MVEALLEQAPWLTPTSLFLLLNLVIATILISSAFSNRLKHPPSPSPSPPPLSRNPSLFSRVTSFNFSNYYHDYEPGPAESATQEPDSRDGSQVHVGDHKEEGRVARAPYLLSRIASFSLGKRNTRVEVCEVDTHCEKVEETEKVVVVAAKKKTTQEKVAEAEEEETTSYKKRHDEVDAKADDFINRFKQQLKMQRLDSLMRYRSA